MFALGILAMIAVLPLQSISESQDSRSTEILNKVSRTYKNYKSIKAGFTIEVNNKASQSSVKQSGTLYVKGKKFRVNMSGQEIYCDGKTIWTYLKDANEVQITKYDEKTMEINPSEIFTIYQKGFLHKYAGQKTVNSKNCDVIELTPEDKSKPYFKVKLAVDGVANKVEEMEIYSKNGVTTKYKITSFRGNVDINDNFFKFDPKLKPGVIEIDLR